MKIISAVFFIFFIGLFSCKNQNHKKQFVVGFSQCTGGDDWRQLMYDEMILELYFHPEIRLFYKDAKGLNSLQNKQIKELIDSKVDLLIVSPNESEPLTHIVDSAYKLGIPVILLDRKIETQNYTTFIGANNYEIGKNAGFIAINKLKGKGEILEIWGLKGSSPAMERHMGFVDAIKNYPDIKVTKQIYGQWIKDTAKFQLQKNLGTTINFDLVYAHNDFMALAAFEFFENTQDAQMKIIGIDGLANKGLGIDQVIQQNFEATILYPTGGDVAIKTASSILEGKLVDKEINLKSTIIDLSNASLMQQQAYEIKKKQHDLERLNNKMSEQFEAYRQQKIILYFFILGFIVTLTLFIWVMIAYRVIKSQKKIIEKQNLYLEDLNATKNKFFSIVAHDLKSPIASLFNFSELIIDSYASLTENQSLELMKKLHRSLNNTIRMSDNLLAWASMQMNESKSIPILLVVQDIVMPIVEIFEPNIEEKRIGVNLKLEKEHKVFADENQLKFIIRNLLNNAIKFTPAGGEITIKSELIDNKTIIISVADTGVGISENQQAKLLNSGINESNMGTAGEKGTGLGLMLVSEFVKNNKGKIYFKSELNKGTIFFVELSV